MQGDPIVQEALREVKAVEELCNRRINPREPDAGPRAVRLFNELSKSYIDAMCDYMAIRPTSTFRIQITEDRD